MKLKYLMILFFLAVFSGCEKKSSHQTPSSHGDIPHILQTLPEQDRKDLDAFFQLLSRHECFSYTLFGNKPISIACYPSQASSSDLYHPKNFLILEKGWEVWQSYASLFPSDEFVLKRYKNNDEGLIEIYLINKKHALQVISDNLDTFQFILGNHVNPQKLVEQLCDSQQDIMEILNDNSVLGILFGYGKINSRNFERTSSIIDNLNAKMTPPFSADDEIKSLSPMSRTFVDLFKNKPFSYPSKECFPSSDSASLSEELNELFSHKDFFEVYGSDALLDKMMPPAFAVRRDSLETKKLQEDYLATKQKVDQVYLHGSFLEITLNQWMYPQ